MEEEITSPKRVRLDSNRLEHPIFGSPVEKLPSNRFPSFLQIVNNVRFLKSQGLMSNLEIYKYVADDLVKTWESAYVVPIINRKTLADKLNTEVEKKMKYVTKNLDKILDVNNPEKRTNFVSEVNKVFNISKCSCFVNKETKEEIVPSNCVCKHKIINLDCYAQQMFKTLQIFVSEEDKLKFSKMVDDLEKKSPKKRSPQASSSSTSPEENIYEKKYLPTNQRLRPVRPINYNMSLDEEVPDIPKETPINWDHVIETCIAQGNKPYAIMKIVNSMIVALKLPPHLIWSQSTLRRRIHDLYARNAERHGELFTELKVIGFDERKDQTLQKNGKSEPEKHLTFTNEQDYVDQATIQGPNR